MSRAALRVCLATAVVSTAVPAARAASVLLDSLAGRQVFPASNWWNLDVSAAPVDARSSQLIAWISGRTGGNTTAVRRLHPDFGPPPYGIPYVVVDGAQPRVPVTFVAYPAESDTEYAGLAGYPIPADARTQPNYIEGAVAGGGTSGDRHLLLIDRDRWLLYETFATEWNATLSRWEAGSGAIFDLSSNARRPERWTSADAAGLAMFPGLVRYDEVIAAGEITHAFRVTTRATNGYVWPASHAAGSNTSAPPMGARLRLKASTDLSRFTPEVQKIFRAMKRYGLIVADNGSDMYISGTMDARWNNDVLNPAFRSLTADDFEVLQLGWGQHAAVPRAPVNFRLLR
ncbi:MAG TPA: hypothetical protein VE379_11480 [Vicinamibacterales bacterium]|nr:hypothetical protein [Vicinamibacterales bacterium]